ncbi:MAG TPA: HDIG domain-containing protein, partial [Ardenticatenaceae bacterium]|nr:HDIG domain-containing protein [Ardenticatenaceae bacterium]
LLVGLAAAGKLLISMGGMLPYLVPTAAGAMLVAVLLNVQLAAALTVMLALVLGFMGDSLELAAYTVIGGVIAALSLHRVDRLGTFVWSTGLVALANVGVVMSFGLLSGFYLPLEQLRIAGAAVVNGFLCASLAIAALYFVSNWLGVTTFLQLVELGRPTSPLFKELLVKAPGTYHHSIMVSNLAERAAEEIGADPLLVRIGAYYHDVGKTRKPEFFVENQANGHNPHDDLDDPWESARLIIAHVAEGVKLARKHNLPPQIVDFIRQHHGTTVVGYFYHKAVERVGADQVRIEDFRYPGPRPQSREGGILLLADAVEAAARAERPDGPVAIEALVRKLAAKRFADGQFDECDLTLRDLERICSAFVEVLQGIYHPRVRYPQEVSAGPQTSEASEDFGSVAQPLAAGAVASALPASPAAVETGGDGGQPATEGVNEGAAARGSPGGGLRQELGSLPVEGMVISAEQRSASDRPALGAAG